ncbi:MAG: hypothetical protein M3133_04725 [Actinomycetota bacterium]|nr:hypothetical protein [Actinomycetota bacterium]
MPSTVAGCAARLSAHCLMTAVSPHQSLAGAILPLAGAHDERGRPARGLRHSVLSVGPSPAIAEFHSPEGLPLLAASAATTSSFIISQMPVIPFALASSRSWSTVS